MLLFHEEEMFASLQLIWFSLALSGTPAFGSSCLSDKCVDFSASALIPARAGSKGIKDKNLAQVGNETLLARAIKSINECGKFESVWVSTDGQKIAEEAVTKGAKVHWRSPETATDNATTLSAVQDFLKHHPDINTIAVVQCTSPFIKPEFICSAFDLMMNQEVDCAFSVTRTHQLKWAEKEDGYVKPINFDPRNRPRRQDWEGQLVENGMFYLARRKIIMEDCVLQNDRCKIVEIPKKFALDVDSLDDLIIARSIVNIIHGGY